MDVVLISAARIYLFILLIDLHYCIILPHIFMLLSVPLVAQAVKMYLLL